MKLGTHVRLPDGRVGTVVFNGLAGVGIKWGLHDPDPADFEGTTADLFARSPPADWKWEPDALLRAPWSGCARCGWDEEQCVGDDYELLEES